MPRPTERLRTFSARSDTEMQIYLDNSATTKICPEALEVYTRVSLEQFGNPSSLHGMGHEAQTVTDEARKNILSSVSAKSGRVIFTASGTEANNLAIMGRAYAKERYLKGAKIITTEGEHSSVSEPIAALEKRGFKVARLSTVGGRIDLSELERELTADTILVSVMLTNNETGAVYDLPKISRLTHAKAPDALVHTDATQAYMKIPFSLAVLGADMLTISSHKIEGPKGVGALIVNDRVIKERGLTAEILGGGQEGGLRSGTENVPGIAAFGEAVRVGALAIGERVKKLDSLRTALIDELRTRPELQEISITLPRDAAPHILNITLPFIKSETMLHFLSSRGIFVSSGSACSSNSHHRSAALLAFGRSGEEADSSIRISLSHRNERADIDALCDALAEGLSSLARIRR